MNKKHQIQINSKFIVVVILLVLIAALAVNLSTAQTVNPKGSDARVQRISLFESASAVGRGVDAITDGSFEAGITNPNWASTSTNFGTVLCDASCGGVGPRTGTIWAWFGGAAGNGETGTLTQSLTINDLGTGTASLEFYLWHSSAVNPTGTDTLTITLGGTNIFATTETVDTYNAAYTLVSLDVSSFDDGVARDLVITGTDLTGNPTSTNFHMDDFALVIEGAEGTPTATVESTATATEGTPASTPTATATEGTPAATPTATETEVTGTQLVANGGFEEEALDPWVLKNGVGEKVKCNTETKVVANSGECAFQFKGGAGESSKIQQNVELDGLTFVAGDVLDLSVFANAKKATASGKIKVVVKYSDSDDRTKLTGDIATTVGYVEVTDSDVLLSAAVSKIKFQVGNKSPDGKIYVDDVSLVQTAGVPALLPLP
jgi:hypothetical protein